MHLRHRAKCGRQLRQPPWRDAGCGKDAGAGLNPCAQKATDFRLRPLLGGQVVQIVDQQKVDVRMRPPKLRRRIAADGDEQLPAQLVRRYGSDSRVRRSGGGHLSNGVHQMGLARARWTVEQQHPWRVAVAGSHGRGQSIRGSRRGRGNESFEREILMHSGAVTTGLVLVVPTSNFYGVKCFEINSSPSQDSPTRADSAIASRF